jgi:hypothetical protein
MTPSMTPSLFSNLRDVDSEIGRQADTESENLQPQHHGDRIMIIGYAMMAFAGLAAAPIVAAAVAQLRGGP